jgi:hypothetical protein
MRSFHENVLLNLVQAPAVPVDGTLPASYIDMSDYERIVFLIWVGVMNAGDLLDAQVVQATDAAGAGSKNITGAAITQLTATDDGKLVSIEVRDTALDVENSFRFVSLTLAETSAPPFAMVLALLYKGGGLPPTQPTLYAEQVEVS